MLNITKLVEAVNNASMTSGGGYQFSELIESVETFDMPGLTLIESMQHASVSILEETAEYMEFEVSVNEIIAEAAISNPDRVDILSENAINTMINKVKEVFNKIIGFLKGIFEKIKNFFTRFKKKKEDWSKETKEAVEKVEKMSDKEIQDLFNKAPKQSADDYVNREIHKDAVRQVKTDGGKSTDSDSSTNNTRARGEGERQGPYNAPKALPSKTNYAMDSKSAERIYWRYPETMICTHIPSALREAFSKNEYIFSMNIISDDDINVSSGKRISSKDVRNSASDNVTREDSKFNTRYSSSVSDQISEHKEHVLTKFSNNTKLGKFTDEQDMFDKLGKAIEPEEEFYADITGNTIRNMKNIIFDDSVEKFMVNSYKDAIEQAATAKSQFEHIAGRWSSYKPQDDRSKRVAEYVSGEAHAFMRKAEFDMKVMNQVSSMIMGQFNKMTIEYMKVLTRLAHIYKVNNNDPKNIDPQRVGG